MHINYLIFINYIFGLLVSIFKNNIKNEIEKRRTFAIISHPDAGKTTLTEKFLLYGGAIQTAGSVKGKATAKHAVSDWMEIEKQRGISVTSSVLQFEYNLFLNNLLGQNFQFPELSHKEYNGLNPWNNSNAPQPQESKGWFGSEVLKKKSTHEKKL